MTVWVALLRGVNVGGAGRLPMAGFRDMLAELGLERPETYIQSGNAVFGSALERGALTEMIADGIAARFGFRPEDFLRRGDEIAAALVHPFGDAALEQVHAFFLAGAAPLDAAAVAALAAPTERWHLSPGVFHLHAPDGIGRSKLAARLPRLLPVAMTARNLRTVATLDALVRARG